MVLAALARVPSAQHFPCKVPLLKKNCCAPSRKIFKACPSHSLSSVVDFWKSSRQFMWLVVTMQTLLCQNGTTAHNVQLKFTSSWLLCEVWIGLDFLGTPARNWSTSINSISNKSCFGLVCCVMHVKEPSALIVKRRGLPRVSASDRQHIAPHHHVNPSVVLKRNRSHTLKALLHISRRTNALLRP